MFYISNNKLIIINYYELTKKFDKNLKKNKIIKTYLLKFKNMIINDMKKLFNNIDDIVYYDLFRNKGICNYNETILNSETIRNYLEKNTTVLTKTRTKRNIVDFINKYPEYGIIYFILGLMELCMRNWNKNIYNYDILTKKYIYENFLRKVDEVESLKTNINEKIYTHFEKAFELYINQDKKVYKYVKKNMDIILNDDNFWNFTENIDNIFWLKYIIFLLLFLEKNSILSRKFLFLEIFPISNLKDSINNEWKEKLIEIYKTLT